MSLMRLWGVRSVLASFVEMIFFFCVLTSAYFLGAAGLYLVVTGGFGSIEPAPFHEMFSLVTALPLWAILLLGLGYLLLIVFYWAPGEKQDCEVELRGLVLFLVVALIAAGVALQWRYGAISALMESLL